MKTRTVAVLAVVLLAGVILVVAIVLLSGDSSSSEEKTPVPTPVPATSSDAGQSDVAAHKAVIQRLVTAGYGADDREVLNEVFAADYVGHLPPSVTDRGDLALVDYQDVFTLLHSAVPDLQVNVERMVAEGDLVATQATLRGTFRSEFFDLPPTNQPIDLTFTVIHRFNAEGKIAEEWISYDTQTLMAQFEPDGPPED